MTLLQTDFLPTRTETFQTFRHLIAQLGLQPGIVNPTDFKVVQRAAGATMSVDIGPGEAWVSGTSVVRQGMYHQTNDATVNIAVTTSDPTNPRIDQIILAVNDSTISGVSDVPTLTVVAGTPAAGATLDNRNGAVSAATMNTTYPNRIRLADVLVPAASTSVVTANIRDRRSWARGFRYRIVGTSTTIGSGNGPITGVDFRGEFVSTLMRWSFIRAFSRQNNAITEATNLGLLVSANGAADTVINNGSIATTNGSPYQDWTGLWGGSYAAMTAGTNRIRAYGNSFSGSLANVELEVEEILRPDAYNS